jgi:co-chaperonin GroES (HSP10)
MGTLNKETWEVTPAQHFCLVRPDPERAHKATTGGGLIRLSDGDASATDHVRDGLKSEFGIVTAVGPGRWFEGDWVAPPCKVGDLILYDRSHSTLPLLVRGEGMTLVAAHQVLYVEPAEAAELKAG